MASQLIPTVTYPNYGGKLTLWTVREIPADENYVSEIHVQIAGSGHVHKSGFGIIFNGKTGA